MQNATNKPRNKMFIIFLILVIVGLLYLLRSILLPFVAGALLAYLCDPLVNRLMHLHLSRLIAVIIVFSVLFFSIVLLILLLIPLIEKQIIMLIKLIPAIINWTQIKLLPLIENLSSPDISNAEAIKSMLTENLMKAGSAVGWAFKATLQSGKALFEGIISLLLIPVVTFYLLRDWNTLLINITQLIPRKIKPLTIQLAKECDLVLGAFFRGQLLVILALCIVYSIGLSIIGSQVGVIIGIISGIAGIVPYLGVILGVTTATIAALVQFGTLKAILWVLLVFLVGHIVENVFLTPILIGDRIGLHPVAVIFAVLAGGALFGFFGVLLALPVAAVIMVLLKHLNHHYHNSPLYKA